MATVKERYQLEAALQFPLQMEADLSLPMMEADLAPVVRVGEHIQMETYPFVVQQGEAVIHHGMGTRIFNIDLWNEHSDRVLANARPIDGNHILLCGFGRDFSGTAVITFKRR